MERDPRKDPRPGDVVQVPGDCFYGVARAHHGGRSRRWAILFVRGPDAASVRQAHRLTDDEAWQLGCMGVTRWRTLTRRAEVVERGPDA